MPDLRDHIRRRIVRPTNPAAGADLFVTVPGTEVWVVEHLRFQFDTSAAVATRGIALLISDQTTEYSRLPAAASQAASLTRIYAAFHGSAGAVPVGDTIPIAFPDGGLTLLPGHQLRVNVDAVQGADQISVIGLSIIAYPTGPRVTPLPGVELLAEPRDGAGRPWPAYATP